MKREVESMKWLPSLRSGVRGSRITHRACRSLRAFTLIELLVVIAIMGILAAIAMPAMNKLKPNAMAAATQKLLADVGRARQLAIAHHTIVYMVFVPPGFWNDTAAFNKPAYSVKDQQVVQSLAEKQMVGYNFVTLRSIGDQPGRSTVRYLDEWHTLPEGAFIPFQKFDTNAPAFNFYTNTVSGPVVSWFSPVLPFAWTTGIPFPSETTPAAGMNQQGQPFWIHLPFIAFNYLGQLVDASGQPLGRNVFIPLSQGSVMVDRDANKAPRGPFSPPPAVTSAIAIEKPVGNTTNAFNVINIDWLTGRARVERQEVL